MTKPMPLDQFEALPRTLRTVAVDGLSAAIDAVAERAPESHRFLRYQWYAAAVDAYGGHSRTILVSHDGAPLIALPLVEVGPPLLRLAQVPGCYWPFRGFPARPEAGNDGFAVLTDQLARDVRGLRIGPVHEDDPIVGELLRAMRDAGWAILDRQVGTTTRLDLAGLSTSGAWPRGSTLRKNRFHEKHLAERGALDWRFFDGPEFPKAFDTLADVERLSWVAKMNGDAKFADDRHGRFWQTAALDPALAAMFHAALLGVAGRPAAFSFDLDCGSTRYAIANSYDPAFAKHSPGKLLQYRNLTDAATRGVANVDWGAGDSGYKATLGAIEGSALIDWLLLRPGLSAAVGKVLAGWWRRSGQTTSQTSGDLLDAR